jgi:hypothetical protein
LAARQKHGKRKTRSTIGKQTASRMAFPRTQGLHRRAPPDETGKTRTATIRGAQVRTLGSEPGKERIVTDRPCFAFAAFTFSTVLSSWRDESRHRRHGCISDKFPFRHFWDGW